MSAKRRTRHKASRQRQTSRTPPKQIRRRWLVVPVAALVVGLVAAVYLTRGSPRGDVENAWSSGAAQGFNVVVVTLDTTRADRLGCYGYKAAATPVLDRLAAEGIRFADAVSPAPLTLPAHASIFTGLDPPNHGVRHNGTFRLDEAHTTLAEVLLEHGYDTAAFVSAFVLDGRYGLDQGFVHFDGTFESQRGQASAGRDAQRSARAVTDAALDWLRSRPAEKPFLLWVHYFDPHFDYSPPQPFAGLFRANPYDGEIAYMDSQLGRLVAALDQTDDAERTLMIIVGDHGDGLGEHYEQTHSLLIYEATQHVPLIVRSPGLFRGPYVVDDVVVSISDVFATVLDLLGIDHNPPGDGISLLKCRDQPNRMVYMETMATYLEHGWAPLHGLRRHRDKYVFAPTPEYYDLESDPHELDNLLSGRPSNEAKLAATELKTELAARMKDSPTAEAVAGAAMDPDRDALRRLQSLGYLGGDTEPGEYELRNPRDMMPSLSLYMDAVSATEAGRYGEALAKLHKVLERSPRDRLALRQLGITCLKLGRIDDAEEAFRKSNAIKPEVEVCLYLFEITTRSQRLEEAKELLQQAIALEPDHGSVIIAQGDWQAVQGHYAEARRSYERAKRTDPYRATSQADRRLARIAGKPG